MTDVSDKVPPTEVPKVLKAPPENPLQCLAYELGWQTAWLRALTLAWSDPQLEADLVADPRSFIAKHCQYELPEGMTLTVALSPKKDGDGVESGWKSPPGKPGEGMWYLPRTEVTIFIPPKPDLDQQPLAVAGYVASGRSYPFSLIAC